MTVEKELALRAELEGSAGTDTFQKNYLVEAGAGAGKSTTMVRRIANLLLKKVCEPEELVAITFTVKATQELREKLEGLLRGKLAEDPDNAELRALVESAERIQVSTIDSFCRTLLSTMPFSNPLGMDFEMWTDDRELGSDFFYRRYREKENMFGELCDRYAIDYRILENAFLQCCGIGDHRPAYRNFEDPLIENIAEVKLPKAARTMRAGAQNLFAECPDLRDTLDPKFVAIMDCSDEEFDWGGEGLNALIPYIRSRSNYMREDLKKGKAYQAIMDKAAWAAVKQKAKDLRHAMDGAVKKGFQNPRKKTAAEYKELRDGLWAIVTAARGEGLLNADAKQQLSSTADLAADAAALDKFQKLLSGTGASRWLGRFDGSSSRLMYELRDVIYPTAETDPKTTTDPKAKKDLPLKPDAFSALLPMLLHAAVMERVEPLVSKYQEEKRERGAATFNDVLVLARNMLRDDEAARAYFRKRYRCYFVDEFQDTDALQTELLFYLTSEEKDFKPGRWQECRPRPGSLFLVGDPKQAIYRFRGADIDTYTRVRECFETEGIGEFRQLAFNFRSTREICDFTERVFRPLLKRDEGGKNYQAEYADMRAVHNAGGQAAERGADPSSAILAYSAGEDEDCGRVAAFVQSAIAHGAARAQDFLILTDVRKNSNAYAKALLEREIPVNISGEESFSKTPVIAAAVIYLDYLLERDDPVRLQLLLEKCYRVSPDTVLRLMQRGALRGITEVFRAAESENRSWKKLDALTAALRAEPQPDEELLALCAVLDEIRGYLQLSVTAPAVSTLERLFSDVACLWPEEGARLERRRDYARVRQFMSLLRGEQARDFPNLARRAISLAEETVEAELPLEPDGDCVRVMNVHKAKGLQGKIVILAYGNSLARDKPVSSCRELSPKGEPLFHFCVTVTRGKGKSAHTSVIGTECGWEEQSAEEGRYLSAERTRLLYVAATRAERVLLVNACPSWEAISQKIGDTDSDGAEPAPPSEKSAAWVQRRAENAGDEGERALLAALAELYPGSSRERIIETVYPEKDRPGGVPDEDDQALADAVRVEPAKLARARQELVGQCASPTRIAITPSALEHAYRPRADAIASKGDREEAPAETGIDRAGDVGGAEDALAQFDPSDAAPLPQSAPVPVSASPHGMHWGTVVHRVMELAVNHQAYDAASLRRFARQAAFETLSGKDLSVKERGMLCCAGTAGEAAVIASVAEAAEKAAAFLSDDASPLRRLLARGRSYTELPFVLRSEGPNNALYRHMSAHLKDRPDQPMPLDVNGSIDLAVLCDDGSWSVVDYKTDRQRAGEDEAALRSRLAAEYTPQIAAYAKVLEALHGGSVTGAYLCSIPLHGGLIDLALDGADTPAAAQPMAAGAAVAYPLTELLTGRRSFSSKLDSAAGSTGFSLLWKGRAIPLTDKHGITRESFKMCRDFSLGVSGWVSANWPAADASVDFTNAGSVVVLRRTLKMLRKALPSEAWESLEFSWGN